MRNILSAAQLMSDRLVDVDDLMVKRFAPKLLRTIDRAVGYTTEVLSFGQTTESAPRRRRMHLLELVDEVRDILAIDPESGIEFVVQMSPDLEVDADSEQLFRIIHNLCRNAHQALVAFAETAPDSIRRITVSARRIGSVVSITVDDTGPGMPQKARENLFTAFRGSARSGGTGLGLAIARELVLAHGGTIALVENPPLAPSSASKFPTGLSRWTTTAAAASTKTESFQPLRDTACENRDLFHKSTCIPRKDALENRPRQRFLPFRPRTRSSAG